MNTELELKAQYEHYFLIRHFGQVMLF